MLVFGLVNINPVQANPVGFLKVQGRTIVNGMTGAKVVLKGVNMTTNYYMYSSAYLTAPWDNANEADIGALASAGANSIRLVLRWDYFINSNGVLDTTGTALGYKLIDAYVQWCKKYNMYVILDMHTTPNDFDLSQATIWTNTSAQQNFYNLWSFIAARYSTEPTIAGYDIMNEPMPPNFADWWNTLAPAVISKIRSVDANHIIFVEAPLIGNNSFGNKLADNNIVYSFHDYEPFVVTHKGIKELSDIPVPSDYKYPGKVLIDTSWLTWQPTTSYKLKSTKWTTITSTFTVPNTAGIEFATLKLGVGGKTGQVWFDNVTAKYNGTTFNVFNSGAETASKDNNVVPAGWKFWGVDTTPEWTKTPVSTNTTRSLKLTSNTTSGVGIWSQALGYYTDQLIKVVPGKTITVSAQVYAPENQGEVTVSVDYLKGEYRTYSSVDREQRLSTLRSVIANQLNWGITNNVPLYLGEFGAVSNAKAERPLLMQDKIELMRREGVSWSVWSYREIGTPASYFSIYLNNVLDSTYANVIINGFKN